MERLTEHSAQGLAPVPGMDLFDKFLQLDISSPSDLITNHITPGVVQNIELFQNLKFDLIGNLYEAAISPFTGKPVNPSGHFGIDSDPWMHSILYEEDGRRFIIICQGLTNTSHLGSIVLPDEKIFLNHYNSWYYSGAYLSRIKRNLPRILDYFTWRKDNMPMLPLNASQCQPLIFGVGNQRVGDFIMQLMMLDELLNHPMRGKDFELEKIFVNKNSEFIALADIFPEESGKIMTLPTSAHVEHHARFYASTLIADVRNLSDKKSLIALRKRINNWLNNKETQIKYAALLREFKECSLTVWVALELEKRVWAEQEEAIPKLIEELSKKTLRKGETIGIVFNGLTGLVENKLPPSALDIIEQEHVLARKITKSINCKVRLFDASGLSLREKIILAHQTDFVMAPIGSASLVPSLLLEKPGIVYAYDAYDRASFAGDNTIIFDPSFTKELPDIKGAIHFATANVSYSINWKDLYNVIVKNFNFERKLPGIIEITVNKSR